MRVSDSVVVVPVWSPNTLFAFGRVISLYKESGLVEVFTFSSSLFSQEGDVLCFEEQKDEDGMMLYLFHNRIPGVSSEIKRTPVNRLLGMSFFIGGWIL